MTRRTWSVLLGLVLLLSVIAVVLLHPRKSEEEGFGCQSDTISRKTYSSGEISDISLTTLFLFNSKDIITVIHKGVFTRGDKRYLIDRNYVLDVEKVDGSSIYYIKSKKLHKSEDDVAPDGIVNELLLDNTDFFYVTRIKSHTWLIKGLVLPIMMCVAVPTT